MERYVLARQTVRADDDIDLPLTEICEDSAKLLRRTSTGDVVDTDGEVLQSLGEGAVVLVCQDRRRDEDGDLLAVGGSLEGGTHGYLRLSEADIPTEETVHRVGALHIGLHSGDGSSLVGGVLEGERCLELVLEVGIGAEGKALRLTTLGVEAYQITGDILDALLRALLDTLPCPRADRIERDFFPPFARAVVGELVQAMQVDIDGVIVAVDELDELLHVIALRHTHQAVEAPDTVVGVDDEVATAEALDLLQRECDLPRAGLVAAQGVLVVAVEELVLGEKHPAMIFVDEALVQTEGHLCG